MQIEVLNGGDGVVVRMKNPEDEEIVATCPVLEEGQKVVLTLPTVHEVSGVEFADPEPISGEGEEATEEPAGGEPGGQGGAETPA